jgi:hypothetical protein
MGIFVSEDLTINNGITLKSFYVSVGTSPIGIEIRDGVYFIEGSATYWMNEESRNTKAALKITQVETKLTREEFISEDVYEHVYKKLKSKYSKYTNII